MVVAPKSAVNASSGTLCFTSLLASSVRPPWRPKIALATAGADTDGHRLHDHLARHAVERVAELDTVEDGEDDDGANETDGDTVGRLLESGEAAGLLLEPTRSGAGQSEAISAATARKSISFQSSAVVPIHHISIV